MSLRGKLGKEKKVEMHQGAYEGNMEIIKVVLKNFASGAKSLKFMLKINGKIAFVDVFVVDKEGYEIEYGFKILEEIQERLGKEIDLDDLDTLKGRINYRLREEQYKEYTNLKFYPDFEVKKDEAVTEFLDNL
jgi:hypothetical protein